MTHRSRHRSAGRRRRLPAAPPPRRGLPQEQPARVRHADRADRHHGVVPGADRRHAVPAAEPHQPGAAEQLHRHDGAGHAAGDRGRPHRPVGGLGVRLHRRAGGRADGASTTGPSCRPPSSCLPGRRASSARRRAGSWPIFRIPSVHRHAGRHAGVQGPDPGAAGGASRSGPFPEAFQQPAARASFPTCSAATSRALHARCCSARWPRRGAWCSSSCAAAPSWRQARHGGPSPTPSSSVKNLFFAAVIAVLRATCWRPTRACPTC